MPQGLTGALHFYFYKQGRVETLLPLLHSFKPLYVNFNTVTSKLCPTPMGGKQAVTILQGSRVWKLARLDFISSLATRFPVLLKLLFLFTTKALLQRLSRLCEPEILT